MKGLLQSRFLKNAGIYAVSDILNKMVPFVLLPILTRYLTPSDYGLIAIFSVFTSILGVFISLEMHSAILVKYFKLSRDKLKIFIANVLIIVAVTTVVVLLVILIFGNHISESLDLPTEWLIIGVFVTLLTFFTTINLILWQSEHKPLALGIYQITQTIFNLALSIILVVGFSMGWEGRLIAASAAVIIFGSISFTLLFKRNYVDLKIDKSYIKEALNFGLPLLPHALSTWVRSGIDRIFLTIIVSTSATGLYTVGFQIASVILIIVVAFNKAYTPFLYEKLKDITEKNKKELVKYSYLYFIILLVISAVLILIAPYIVEIFVGEEFGKSQDYISWFAFGFAFYGMYSVVANYILFTQKTIYLSYITFIIGLAHVCLSYVLITYNGTIGAAQAFAIITFLEFISVWCLSQKIYPMPWLTMKSDSQ